ncbi:hypothetical protein [Nocardioides currus]|uniref:Uncharacterized protein n=1 Tax=Nocardioides currus TaxID=2133958 RepID=A0A2R7YW12_9ACTN|nr:hypothetical protein [Nocardioides currus]PUA80504.1 hypothetical protein C7S10_12065 [Nocardioides currus]
MQWDVKESDRIVLNVTRQELRMLNNALSEALDRVPDRAFPTLMGAQRDEVGALLGEFGHLRQGLST